MTRLARTSSIALPDEDDVVLQQARIDVVSALSTAGLLDHHRDKRHGSLRALNISNRGDQVKRFLSNHLSLKGLQPTPLTES